jgi:hypothetical protein
MEALDPLAEHGPVALFTHSPRNVDDSIRAVGFEDVIVGATLTGDRRGGHQ